jgi:hypothetical protein
MRFPSARINNKDGALITVGGKIKEPWFRQEAEHSVLSLVVGWYLN